MALRLACLQTRRIMRALDGADEEVQDAASRFLLGMIDPGDRGRFAAKSFAVRDLAGTDLAAKDFAGKDFAGKDFG